MLTDGLHLRNGSKLILWKNSKVIINGDSDIWGDLDLNGYSVDDFKGNGLRLWSGNALSGSGSFGKITTNGVAIPKECLGINRYGNLLRMSEKLSNLSGI